MKRLSERLLLLFSIFMTVLVACTAQQERMDEKNGISTDWRIKEGQTLISVTKNDNQSHVLYYLEQGRLKMKYLNSKQKPAKFGKPSFTPTALLPVAKNQVVIAGSQGDKVQVAYQKGKKTKWLLTLPDSITGTIHSIAKASDGGYWLGGETPDGYLVASVDSKGKLRWIQGQAKTRQGDAIPSGIRSISQTSKGDLLAIGYADPFLFDEKNAFVLRMKASDGKTVASFDFGRERKDDFGLAVSLLPDGNYQALVQEDSALVQYRSNNKGRVLYKHEVAKGQFSEVQASALPGSFLVSTLQVDEQKWNFHELEFVEKHSAKKNENPQEIKPKNDDPTEPEPEPEPVTVTVPKVRALIVGHSPGDSQFSVKDADDLALLLMKKSEAGNVKASVDLLTSNRAYKQGILESLKKMETNYKRGLMDKDELLLVSFTISGHKTENGNFVFCPSDWDPVKPEATGISMAELEKHLQNIPNPKLLLLDASYSGMVQTRLKNTLAITSCGSAETSHESLDWKNGAFMFAVKEALNGKADTVKDQQLSTPELAAYLLGRVSELAKSKGFEQHPGVVKQADAKVVILH
jgi:hypothetical protein